MIEEIAIALALLAGAAIALAVRGRAGAVGREIDRAVHPLRSLLRAGVLRSAWSNPLLRLACPLLLLIAAGWAATLTQVGIEETRRAIQFQRPSAHEARECYLAQEIVVLNIQLEAQVEDIFLKPGPLDPRLPYECPLGGAYSLDDSGRLRCSRHGSAPGIPTVPFSPGRGDRP